MNQLRHFSEALFISFIFMVLFCPCCGGVVSADDSVPAAGVVSAGQYALSAEISPAVILYGAFPGYGLWKHNGSSWSQLTSDTPQGLAAAGPMLYGDFGTLGLWQYNGTSWSLLTPDNPENIVASETVLYGDFGALGLWKYNGNAWSQLTSDNPQTIAVSGTTLYGGFGSLGLWKNDGTGWSRLTSENPQNIAASGSLLYGDFGTLGLWRYDGTSWSLLTPDNPQNIAASGTTLYGDFGILGLWKHDGANWSLLTPDNPESIAACGSILYGDFGALGLWKYDGANWSLLTSDNPSIITCSTIVSASPGSLDNSFGTGGIVVGDFTPNAWANAAAVQDDGKILIAGISGSGGAGFIARFNSDGSLDTGFGYNGSISTIMPKALLIQPDGKIVIAGGAPMGTHYDFAVARYNPNGMPDADFGSGGVTITSVSDTYDDIANAVAIQADGKIVVAGYISDSKMNHDFMSRNYDFAVVRYNADGNIDSTFGTGGKVITDIDSTTHDEATSVQIQNDGKIVVSGNTVYNPLTASERSCFATVRYNSDGGLDLDFGTGGKKITDFGGISATASASRIQSDGKIIVAGSSLANRNMTNDFALVRYNTDGSEDTTFGSNGIVNTDINSSIYSRVDVGTALAIQADGKIIIAGYSRDDGLTNNSDFALARYNPNGTLDNSFGNSGIVLSDLGTQLDEAFALALQSNGRIVVAGRVYNGWYKAAISRYVP